MNFSNLYGKENTKPCSRQSLLFPGYNLSYLLNPQKFIAEMSETPLFSTKVFREFGEEMSFT